MCCSEKYEQFFLRLYRLILFLVGVFGMVCAGFTLASCRLISYDSSFAPFIPLEEEEGDDEDLETRRKILEYTTAHFGLFRYDPDGNGCREFSWDYYGGTDLQLAKMCCCLVMITSFSALMVIWVEYLCCRFCCGRVIAANLLLLSAICQGTALLLLNSPLCRVEKREDWDGDNSGPFPCDVDRGAYVALAAMATFVFAAMMVCITAKPQPVCKTLREMDENDPCLCPARRKVDEDDEGGKDEEGDPEDEDLAEEEEEKDDAFFEDEEEASTVLVMEDEKVTRDIVFNPSQDLKQRNLDEEEKPYKGKHQDAEVVDNDLFFDTKSRRSLSFNFGTGAGDLDVESGPSPKQPKYSLGEKQTTEPSADESSPLPAVKGVSIMVADSIT